MPLCKTPSCPVEPRLAKNKGYCSECALRRHLDRVRTTPLPPAPPTPSTPRPARGPRLFLTADSIPSSTLAEAAIELGIPPLADSSPAEEERVRLSILAVVEEAQGLPSAPDPQNSSHRVVKTERFRIVMDSSATRLVALRERASAMAPRPLDLRHLMLRLPVYETLQSLGVASDEAEDFVRAALWMHDGTLPEETREGASGTHFSLFRTSLRGEPLDKDATEAHLAFLVHPRGSKVVAVQWVPGS